jgi:predicted transcriptional regulator
MENIKDVAIATEKRNVRVPIEAEELEGIKEMFVEKSKNFKQLADEKTAAVKSFNELLTPVKKEIDELMQDIQNEFREVNTTVYLLDDQEANLMRFYLEDGTEVGSRPLRPDEKQLNILSIKKAGEQ